MADWMVRWVDSRHGYHSAVMEHDDPVELLRYIRSEFDVLRFVVNWYTWRELEDLIGASRDQIWKWDNSGKSCGIDFYWKADDQGINHATMGDLMEFVHALPATRARSDLAKRLRQEWAEGPRHMPGRAIDEEVLDHLLS